VVTINTDRVKKDAKFLDRGVMGVLVERDEATDAFRGTATDLTTQPL
jgi:hypothetical protein